ncbi:MAG: toxin-activating lysine-acyltransferase [Acetobacteraceae bacterium]|nr:toxin-activating lysine-acyltransferase [Acetobacteraceae bacterium]
MPSIPPTPPRVQQLANPMAALGAALHFLARRTPFAGFRAEVLTATVHGQIRRGHYRVALEGQRMRGYIGWAMLDTAVAERVVRGGPLPTEAEAEGGEVVWLLTVATTDRPALLALLAAGRALHPGRRVMGVRRRPNGHAVLIDRRIGAVAGRQA